MDCPSCGFSNLVNARFCSGCGAELVAPDAVEARKTVTVLFCDVTGSTELAARNDPETMRSVMTRFFEHMRSVLERHGGTVEKFIGDAVMALFGVPVVHEDDAMRAARAAWEMTGELEVLNADLRRQYDVVLQVRIGVNTGEVVVGQATRGTLATGDAVNVAARLQQAAEPGQVLLGESTYRLARDVVEAEPVGALQVKGRSDPVSAWRMTACAGVAAATRSTPAELIGPLVGRERELLLLEQLLERASAERTCQLVTLLGAAGVGKTRLMDELTRSLAGRATVVGGRCLSYGDGVALWPLLEALRAFVGQPADDDEGRARIAELVADDPDAAQLAERLASLAGFGGAPPALTDVRWAIRRWLELVGAARPVVLVIDDLHWAEAALLDVLEDLVDWTRDAAVLVVCLGRPEFLDGHPQWAGGKLNATNLLLAPLSGEASNALLDRLLGDEVAASVRDRVQPAAGGNPLFLEQLLAMLVDTGALTHGGNGWVLRHEVTDVPVPPSISAVLAARLDRLQPGERSCLQAAAVVGQVFYQGAVAELVSDAAPDTVRDWLLVLSRKQLVRPDRSDITGEEAYRFEHVLVRDEAYGSVPKRRRAELHERFARWLDKRAAATAAATEIDEFVGYHLEQAVLLARDVSPVADEATTALVVDASYRLSRAAEATYVVDPLGATALFERAAALHPTGSREELELLLRAAETSSEGADFTKLFALTARVRELAGAAGMDGLVVRAMLHESAAQLATDPGAAADQAFELARAAADRFAAQGDDAGLATAYATLGYIFQLRGRWGDLVAAHEVAAQAALRTGDRLAAQRHDIMTRAAWVWGPTSAEEALGLLGAEPDPARPRSWQAGWHMIYATFAAYRGRMEETKAHMAAMSRLIDQLHLYELERAAGFFAAAAGWALGRLADFEPVVARSAQLLEEQGDVASLSTLLPYLGQIELDRGNQDVAAQLAERARDMTNAADPMSQMAWRMLRSQVLARRGDFAEALGLLDEAVEWIHRSDQTNEQAELHETYACVARMAGEMALAERERRRAQELYQAKGNVAAVRRLAG